MKEECRGHWLRQAACLLILGAGVLLPACLQPMGCSALGTAEGAAMKGQATYALSDWMSALSPVIGNMSLLDLSLPGTHDSMTWDLSTTISDGANDLPPPIAWVLHEFHDLAPGHFIKNQSRTQGLSMTQQLDNGIRFIDFRIMYTSGPNSTASADHDWYCLHMLQTNQRAVVYLRQARAWLDAHAGEFLVLWLSRHGNPCAKGEDQYPNVPDSAKHVLWNQVQELFGDLIFDQAHGLLNETTLTEMKQRSQRVVLYVSDYARFTGNSTQAIDACLIDNQLGDSVQHENSTFHTLMARFARADTIKRADKASNRLYLQSMAAGAPLTQIESAALLHFLPEVAEKEHTGEKCAAAFDVPGMTSWCPPTLMDISLLTNYYNQRILDAVITQDLALPNAIYIDAVDVNGTIRTGTALIKGDGGSSGTGSGGGDVGGRRHTTTSFAYVDTVVLYNLQRACARAMGFHDPTLPRVCKDLAATLKQRRKAHPLTLWNDTQHGRVQAWP